MDNSDNTMNDENEGIPTEDANDWEGLTFTAGHKIDDSAADLLAPDLPEQSDDEYDEPSADLLKEDKRKPYAARYQKKVNSVFKLALSATLDPSNELKMADSAAIILYGPDISEAMGDLAANDKRIAKAIDFLADDVVSNPALAVTMATLPFVLQVLRNHEDEALAEVSTYRELRIPFTKRSFKLKIKFPKLGRFARNQTVDPRALNAYVYTRPQIQEMLKMRGIDINFSKTRR